MHQLIGWFDHEIVCQCFSKGVWLLNTAGEEIIVDEGKEAILSPGDILKFNRDKFHYRVGLKREKNEEDTDSEEEEDTSQQKNEIIDSKLNDLMDSR